MGRKSRRRAVARACYYAAATSLMVATGVLIGGCSGGSDKVAKRDPFAGVGSPYFKGSGPMPKGGGRRVVGEPYEIAGQKFVPREDPGYDRVGVASWYGPQFHRRMTSNGEWFNMDDMTAAHTTLPLPSYVKVTNLENGRSVVVRVNDRGPFVDDRIIDMSRKSAQALGFERQGRARTRVQYIGPAPINDPRHSHLMAMNEADRDGTPLASLIAAADRRGGATSVAMASASPRPKPQSTVVAATAPRPVAAAVATRGEATADYAGWFVQVAAFSDPVNAERARTDLATVGPVVVTAVNGGTRTLYRVKLGPLDNEERASQALGAVQARGHGDARIVAED